MSISPAFEFRLSIDGSTDDTGELHDLHEAIRDDHELVGVRSSLGPMSAPEGAMGAEEIVRIIFDNPALCTAVSACVTAWLATRKSRRLKVIIRANGTAEIQADGIKEITAAEVAEALRIAREHQQGGETAGQ